MMIMIMIVSYFQRDLSSTHVFSPDQYTCLDWCVSELSRMLTRACAPSPIYDEILIIYTRAHA